MSSSRSSHHPFRPAHSPISYTTAYPSCRPKTDHFDSCALTERATMNNNWQEEAMRRLRQMQQQGGRGGGPKMPRGMGGAAVGGLLLAGGAMFFSNALFNVDGGHRAIKYRRISGVSPEIYNEGTTRLQAEAPWS